MYIYVFIVYSSCWGVFTNKPTLNSLLKKTKKLFRPDSRTVVYCVHGNKWGIAQCCDDLNAYDSLEDDEELHDEDRGDGLDPVHCHTERREGLDKK